MTETLRTNYECKKTYEIKFNIKWLNSVGSDK